FQIPEENFVPPLLHALDPPAVRRFLFFNSSHFHLFLTPALYIVLWCGIYSSLHLYLSQYLETYFWLFCLSVSAFSVFLTSLLLILLSRNNRQININTDIRLVPVNEALSQYRVLVGETDTVHNCTSLHQLFFVYFDLSGCQSQLCEALEERSFARAQLQAMLRQKLAHLLLVTEVEALDPERSERGADSEETPLLVGEEGDTPTGRTSPSDHRGAPELTKNYSLVPEGPPQASAQRISSSLPLTRLLMTYSAIYVKLLVSHRLPIEQRPLHCQRTNTPCLCQYIEKTVLR
ncbi:TM268 protein, partial [Amia calva]|nr:TM268 protein [Amia calva]